jgi:hypothetical protein
MADDEELERARQRDRFLEIVAKPDPRAVQAQLRIRTAPIDSHSALRFRSQSVRSIRGIVARHLWEPEPDILWGDDSASICFKSGGQSNVWLYRSGVVDFHRILPNYSTGESLSVGFQYIFEDSINMLLLANEFYSSLANYDGDLYVAIHLVNLFDRELSLPAAETERGRRSPSRRVKQLMSTWLSDEIEFAVGENPYIFVREALEPFLLQLGFDETSDEYLAVWGRDPEKVWIAADEKRRREENNRINREIQEEEDKLAFLSQRRQPLTGGRPVSVRSAGSAPSRQSRSDIAEAPVESRRASDTFQTVPERTGMESGSNERVVDPVELRDSLAKLRTDYPDVGKRGFIMMQFGRTSAHEAVVGAIRSAMLSVGGVALRADDKEYHEDLFQNIRTYMHGCDFGIAVFERISSDDFNPNVSLEVGYMIGMGKPVCLLKDQSLRTLPADLVGRLYRPFDSLHPLETAPQELLRWLSDRGIATVPSTPAQAPRID